MATATSAGTATPPMEPRRLRWNRRRDWVTATAPLEPPPVTGNDRPRYRRRYWGTAPLPRHPSNHHVGSHNSSAVRVAHRVFQP